MALYSTVTVLVNLQVTFFWSEGRSRQTLAPIVFAAALETETSRLFTLSLDNACHRRLISAARFTPFICCPILTYETERYFVWDGFEHTKLSIPSLTSEEIMDQLDLIAKRGYRDCIHVEMVVEIGAPEDEVV